MSSRNIGVEYDQIALTLGSISSNGENIKLPEIDTTYLSNTNGFAYFPEVYQQFKEILDNYRALLCRDITMTSDMVGCFIAYDQDALSNYRNSGQFLNESSIEVYTSSNLSESEPSQYSFSTTSSGTDDYYISMQDVQDMCTEIINNSTQLMSACDEYSAIIQQLVQTEGFDGLTAVALKNYWSNVHVMCISKIYTAALTLADHASAYWLEYSESSVLKASLGGGLFTLQKAELDYAKTTLSDFDTGFEPLHTDVTTAISTCNTSTGGAYDYSGYTPDYDGLSSMVQANIGRIDSINTEVKDIEDNVMSCDKQYINDSITEMNDFLNAVIANVNQYNIAYQTNGVPTVIWGAYQDVAESVVTDLEEHANYADALNEGVQNAREHAYQNALDERYAQTEFEILSDVFMIGVSIVSLIGTLGSDAPIAIPVIIAEVDAISFCFATSDLIEDAGTYYYVTQGDLTTEGTNYLYQVYFESLGLSREAYNNTEQVFFFLTSVSCDVNGLSYAEGNYAAGVTKAFITEGAGELAGNAAYQIAIENGASPMQAMLISMVVESGTSGALDHAIDIDSNPHAINTNANDVDGISTNSVAHIDDVADDIGDTARHIDTDPVSTTHHTSDIDAPDDSPAVHHSTTPDADTPHRNVDIDEPGTTVHSVADDTTPNTHVNTDVSDTTPGAHPVDSPNGTSPRPGSGIPEADAPHNHLNVDELDDYTVTSVENASEAVGKPVNNIPDSDVPPHWIDSSKVGIDADDCNLLNEILDGNTYNRSRNSEYLDCISRNWDQLSDAEVYSRIQAIDPAFLARYDLLNSTNIQTYVKIVGGQVKIDWPAYGGFVLSSVTSAKTLRGRGEINVSRVGRTSGATLAIDSADGLYPSVSERSILNSSDDAYQGRFNTDAYCELMDELNMPGADIENILNNHGITDSDTVSRMISEYNGMYSNSDNLATMQGLRDSGRSVDFRYGFVGTAAEWGELSGGATQLSARFSWQSLVDLGIIKDVDTITLSLY